MGTGTQKTSLPPGTSMREAVYTNDKNNGAGPQWEQFAPKSFCYAFESSFLAAALIRYGGSVTITSIELGHHSAGYVISYQANSGYYS